MLTDTCNIIHCYRVIVYVVSLCCFTPGDGGHIWRWHAAWRSNLQSWRCRRL